jgi:spermidine/putrescine transport system substrate-binding protein
LVTNWKEQRMHDHDEGPRLSPLAMRMTRQAMLRKTAGGAAALGASSWLLAACGGSSGGGSGGSGGSTSDDPSLPIGTKNRPITLPISSDNPAIASGKSPERGPFVIYDWDYYLSPAVIKSFEQKYNVKAQLTTFASIDEAVNKIASGAITPDVWVPDAEHIYQVAQSKLIQPINHSYIPNLDKAITAAANPWYDRGARYTSPNFINTFGIGWRNDLVNINPANEKNCWDVFWETPGGTPMGMLNAAPYDAISMTMIRNGSTLEHVSEDDVTKAANDLSKLSNVKWQYTSFQPLGTGV